TRRVDIERRWGYVVVAGQHDRDVLLDEFLRVRAQPREPGELGVEFRPGLRVAVRQIDAGDDDAAHGGLDVACFAIAGVARQRIADQDRLGIAGEDGNPVPGLLPAPHRAVAGFLDGLNWKLGV